MSSAFPTADVCVSNALLIRDIAIAHIPLAKKSLRFID
jgi:hypothetical protein